MTFLGGNCAPKPSPKKGRPWAEQRHLSHKACISAARFELGVGTRKYWTEKKSQKGYNSPIWGEVSIKAIPMKNYVVGDVLDEITCANFQNETFRGYDFTGG